MEGGLTQGGSEYRKYAAISGKNRESGILCMKKMNIFFVH